jgi:hypothetical protein
MYNYSRGYKPDRDGSLGMARVMAAMPLPLSSVTSIIDIGLSPYEHYVQFVPPANFGVIFNSTSQELYLVHADGGKKPLIRTAQKIYALRGFVGLRKREEQTVELGYGVEDDIIKTILRTFKSLAQLRSAVVEYCPCAENAEVITELWAPAVLVEPLTPLSNESPHADAQQHIPPSANCDGPFTANGEMCNQFLAAPLSYYYEPKKWDFEMMSPTLSNAAVVALDPRNLPSPTDNSYLRDRPGKSSSYGYHVPSPPSPFEGSNIGTHEYGTCPAEATPRFAPLTPWETSQPFFDMTGYSNESFPLQGVPPSTTKFDSTSPRISTVTPSHRKRIREPSPVSVPLTHRGDLYCEIQIVAYLQVIRTRSSPQQPRI